MASRPALGPTQHPIQWVLLVVSREVKRPESEADYSPLANVEIKKGGAIPPLHLRVFFLIRLVGGGVPTEYTWHGGH
jgi:hypothetical protein